MTNQVRNLRILLLTTDIGLGGAERVWNDHSVAFSRHYHVEQAVFELNKTKAGYRSHLALHELTISSFVHRLGSFARFIQRVISLHRLVKSRQYDLVISHLEGANLVNVLSCTRAKKILVLHGSAQGDLNHRKLYKFLRLYFLMPFVYQRGDAVVGVSRGTANEIKRYAGLNRVHVIPNFFDANAIEEKAKLPLPESYSHIFGDRPVLITSGRLAKQKNQSFLFMILQELKARKRDVCLVIMGDGEMRRDLLSLADQYQFSTYSCFGNAGQSIQSGLDVYFVGYQDNPFAWLAKSDLFLFPSLWEGHPLALCEALICQIPIISSDCPNGPHEILAPLDTMTKPSPTPFYASNGVLMPMTFDASSAFIWANVVDHLLGHKNVCHQMRENGRSYVKSLSTEVILPRWLSLIAKTARSSIDDFINEIPS